MLDQKRIEDLLSFIDANETRFSFMVKSLAKKLKYAIPEAPVFITGGGYGTKAAEFRKTTAYMFKEAGFKNVITLDDVIELAEPYEDGWLQCHKLMCDLCIYTHGIVVELDTYYFELEEANGYE